MQKYNQIDTQESFKRGPRAFLIILFFHYIADSSLQLNRQHQTTPSIIIVPTTYKILFVDLKSRIDHVTGGFH